MSSDSSSSGSFTSVDDPNDSDWCCEDSSDSSCSVRNEHIDTIKHPIYPLPFDTFHSKAATSNNNATNKQHNKDKSHEENVVSCDSDSSQCSHQSLPFDTFSGHNCTPSGVTRNKKKTADSMSSKRETDKALLRQSGLFFPWTVVANKKRHFAYMKNKINELYLFFLSIGSIALFNRYKIKDAASHKECSNEIDKCCKAANNLKPKELKNRLKINHPIPFMTNSKFGLDEFDNITNREFIQREQTVLFEHKMNSIHLHVCRTCLEYEILFDRSNARKEYDVCDKCKSKKIDYIKENRQPVWYEYNADGSKVCDDNNIPIPQYNIPEELSNLTMAEKLLIRRCCPFIPSVHLKEGILGIKGHCICFPQDVNEVCTILPQLKCQVVKYIREIGNTDSSRHRWEMLRVNRGRVLRALRWLKIHNSEYADIVIDETNLEWMKGRQECSIDTVEYVFPMTPKKVDIIEERDGVAVSERQCHEEGSELELPMLTVKQNQQVYRPPKDQIDMMKDIRQCALDNDHADRVLDFPTIDNINPVRLVQYYSYVFLSNFHHASFYEVNKTVHYFSANLI